MDSTGSAIPDPTDPLFLFSQRLDGPLSAEDQHRLERALAGSEDLRNEAAKTARVWALIAAQTGDTPEIDSEPFVALVSAEATGLADADLARMDDWLEALETDLPEVDSAAFVRAVRSQVGAATMRRAAYSSPWRWPVPLAAAAAVMLAVTGYLAYQRQPRPTETVIGRSVVAFAGQFKAPEGPPKGLGSNRNAVVYAMDGVDRKRVVRDAGRRAARVEMIVVGSDVALGSAEAAPPI